MNNEVSAARHRAGGDDEFAVEGSDDDFLDDEDDDCTFAKGKGKKKAGPTKPQGKGKVGRSRQGVDGSSFSGQNPKVMLLSLKAVCASSPLATTHLTSICRELLD